MNPRACYRRAFAGFLFLMVAACASGQDGEQDPLCYRAICGCWEDHSLRATVAVVDDTGQPAPGLTLSCVADRLAFGTTDAAGSLRLAAPGRVSPGCGYISDCETVSLNDTDGNVLQTFALTPLLRGEKVVAGTFALSATPVDAPEQ